MKNVKHGLLLTILLMALPSIACTPDGKRGFLPENKLKISVKSKNTGITEEQFNSVIDKAETIYSPIVSNYGGKLVVERKWTDPTVNAYAQQSGTTWKVSMFGGLARHATITPDGFALVVCHEIGHHIGGAPRKNSAWASSWASNEGQSDYFATLKCLRKIWISDNTPKRIRKMNVPAALSAACTEQHGKTGVDYALCVRGGMAGHSVARLFQVLRNSNVEPKFDTPDTKVVAKTDDNHPATQCRLDTYFQGALCDVSMNEDVTSTSEVTGTCHGSLGHKKGTRPLCWFKPSVK